MARQSSNGHGIRPSRSTSAGAAVLDHEETALACLGVEKADLFELIPQPVVVMDRDHTILQLNRTAAEAAGRSIEACVGAKFWDLFDNEDCRAGTCAASQAVNTGKTCAGEAHPVVQGRKIAVRVTAAPVFDDRRHVVGVVELIYPLDTEMKALNQIFGLTKEVQDGKLSARTSLEGFDGLYRQLLEGVNSILDALISPLHVTADYVDQFSRGVIPPKITADYKGDFNMIKSSLNACIDGFGGLKEADAVLQRLAVNDCSIKVQGSYQGIFRDLAKATNTVEEHVIHTIQVFESLARADYREQLDILQKVGKRSDNDKLVPAAIQTMVSIDALVKDAAMLSKAAVEGKLSTRADAGKHQGDFRKIVEGVNATLDAVIGPLNVSAEYVDRISKGDIPPRITDSYNGDFNEIKNNLNACIDAVNSLVADAGLLSKAAVEGKLSTRAEAGKHHGDYRKIVEGVNATLDAVIGPLNVSAEYVDRISKGDIPPQDHRQLQRRLQRDQEQPQRLHRQHQSAGQRDRSAHQGIQ